MEGSYNSKKPSPVSARPPRLRFPEPCARLAVPCSVKSRTYGGQGSCSFKVSQVGAGGTTSSRKFTEGDDKGGGTGGSEVAESNGVITEELDPI